MTIPRASSGMLRSHVPRRAVASTRSGSPLPTTQIRTEIRGPDDLGGPGGQERPPDRPSGPESLKRNWPATAGAGLAVVAAYAYLTGGSPKSDAEVFQEKAREGLQTIKETDEMRGEYNDNESGQGSENKKG